MFRNPASENPYTIEISQSICFSNKVTGYYTKQAYIEMYLQTDYNATCQGLKIKKENY